MGDEGASCCSTRDGLQDGGIYLDVASLIEELAHGVEDLRTLEENLLDVAIDYEVHIALTEAELGVGEAVEGLSILLLDDGKRTKSL